MPLWQRLLITLAVMLLASFLVGLCWHWLFNAENPELSQRRGRRHHGGADLGVPAENPLQALGLSRARHRVHGDGEEFGSEPRRSLVPRTRSSRAPCGDCDRELRVQSGLES